jgi:anti-sigma factor RsiW
MDSPNHLSEREIAAYLDQGLEVDERHRIDAHLDLCSACRAELISVMRLTSAPSGRSRVSRWVWVPAAIAAGLAAVLLLRPPPPGGPASLERPVAGPAESLPRLVVTGPVNGDSVTLGGLTFQWRSRQGDSYRVTVLTESGEPVWTAETTDTSISLPASISLEPGRGYFWRVDAVADGLSATSGVQRFQVVR